MDADISDLFAAISNGTPSRPALVLGTGAARALVFSNSQAFRDVALVGRGSIAGAVTFTTPAAALSAYAIAVDTDGVIVADAGIDVSGAKHASVQLDDAPGAGAYTSLWQQNLIGFRAVRFLAWAKRSDAVAYAAIGGGTP